ncbi:Retrovirus-related Pol polyprotein from transposon RE2 [Vitis vinifera]|uniref:Retrovirus-related Pol polyprotein from transposon RE2 n=1 Tax=Vitis vinifera TaxID=29760 RepID=A0A438I680_VITVI|nr:Retrovirus-related Pol polyprotein from transposon RE2 [Vitis vinifera]
MHGSIIQELQYTVAGGTKVVSGESLSPRSTRGYLRTSLRCKQESLSSFTTFFRTLGDVAPHIATWQPMRSPGIPTSKPFILLIPMATENTQIIIPNAQEPTKPLTMITIHNSIKLTPTNYLSWKTQMEAIFIDYDLQKFIDGSHLAPPTTITTNNVVSTNPAYQTWLRQDKLLFGALVGTLSPTLVPLITQSKTSYEA